MLNKARRKSYVEADNMNDNEWLKALGRFDQCGNLSTVNFAVRAKPDFIYVRPDVEQSNASLSEPNAQQSLALSVASDTTQTVVPRGKRKRDEDYD
jgi:hypothetical protein